MPRSPDVRTVIELALTEHGPMTLVELVDETGLTLQQVGGALTRMRHLGQAHTPSYRQRKDGAGAPAGVWHLGPGPNAPRPRYKTEDARLQARRKAREKHREKYRAKLRIKTRQARGAGDNPFLQLIPKGVKLK